MPAVVIAATNLMPALQERLSDEGELLGFADTEPIQALQAILQHRPSLIVLERLFAATPRGAALINRIKTDPQVSQAEIRVMSHTGDYTRVVSRGAAAATEAAMETASATPASYAAVDTAMEDEGGNSPVATADAPRQLDWHGTRRAPRFRIRQGVEIQLDGNPANLVDLSVMGAQVLSATILRPNQRVRISVPTDDFVMRFRGAVAWAKFELPKSPESAPQYRAGIEFADSDASSLEVRSSRFRVLSSEVRGSGFEVQGSSSYEPRTQNPER